ncbi:MAG: hypothetical protein ACOCWG_04155, partial [bacterium]
EDSNIALFRLNKKNIYVINSQDLYGENDREPKKKLPEVLYNLLKTNINDEKYKLRLIIHDREYDKDPDVFDQYNESIEVLTFKHEKNHVNPGVFDAISDNFQNASELAKNLDDLFDELGVKKLKKQITNLFLPLAIDIQGLHDLKEKEQINDIATLSEKHPWVEYFKEVKASVEKQKELIDELGKLKGHEALKDYKGNVDLPGNVIDEIVENEYKAFADKYLNEQKEFLPAWLAEISKSL